MLARSMVAVDRLTLHHDAGCTLVACQQRVQLLEQARRGIAALQRVLIV
jgi:hypothetical protein